MRLDVACSHIVDCEHKTAPIDADGEYFAVGTPAMREHRIEYAEARRISRVTFEAWTRRLAPSPGDLLLAREAPVGPVVRLPDAANVAPGQRTVLLRPDPQVADSAFLYYALTSPSAQAGLVVKAEGSTVHHLNVPDIRSFDVWVPPLPEQQAIAEVLGALDDKIAANTALAETQRDLARTTWDALRRGADTVPLGDIVTPGLSGVWGEEVEGPNAGVEVYALRGRDLEDLLTGQQLNPPRRWISSTQATRRIDLDAQEIWTAGSGTLGPSLLITPDLRAAMARPLTYSNFVKRLVARDGASGHLSSAWFALWRDWELGNFDNYRTGTAMPNLDVVALLSGVEVPMLPATAQHHVNFWADVVLRRELEGENRVLAATRDALLPQLMSGKLRVRDAEDLIVQAGV